MAEKFIISTVLAGSPERIYRAWLDSEEHGAFTGGEAKIEAKAGGHFTAWGDYIQGITLELEPYRRIVQAWRTSEFPPDAGDSRLEILLEGGKDGTKISLDHSNLPEGQGEMYRQGWLEYYFQPMEKYFSAQG